MFLYLFFSNLSDFIAGDFGGDLTSFDSGGASNTTTVEASSGVVISVTSVSFGVGHDVSVRSGVVGGVGYLWNL